MAATQASTTCAAAATTAPSTSVTSSINENNNAISSVPTTTTNINCNNDSINRIDDIAMQSRNSIQFVQSALRSSAFEVYRKPTIHNQSLNIRTFYSPDQTTVAAASCSSDSTTNIDHSLITNYNKNEKSLADVMHQLKEQNGLLLRLCYDLSEELKTIKQKKEEILQKIDAGAVGSASGGVSNVAATTSGNSGAGSSIAAAAVTGTNSSGITTNTIAHHSAV